MIQRNLTRLLLLTTLFLPIPIVAAASPEQLQSQATEYLTELFEKAEPDARIEVTVNPISSRVKLVTCTQPVQFRSKNDLNSRISLRVSCSQPRWQLYMTAKLRAFKPVVTASRPISKGEIIQFQHLALKERDIASLRKNYISDMSAVTGMAARRAIAAGQHIKSSQLAAATIIRKGDAVTIEARRGGLSIRTAGTALQPGKANQQISVRNEKSGRVIKAVAISPGLVRTP